MKKDITIVAEPRETRGKNEARRLRARGLAPAVVYGAGGEPIAVSVNPKEMSRILQSATGHNTIFNVEVKGAGATPVMIVDYQRDPLKDNLLHIDLKRIDLTKRISVRIPVLTSGDPVGVKVQGGLHEVVTREIEIECLPEDIPEHFTMDVSGLSIGQSVRAADVPLSGSMKLVTPADAVISHVVALRAEAVATEEGAEVEAPVAAGTEPEVIKKGKKEEEAAAGAEEKKKK
jgi:large subunit ribosomal protein L25